MILNYSSGNPTFQTSFIEETEFISKIFIYLFIYKTEILVGGERKRDRERVLQSAGSLPKLLQWSGLGQVKFKSTELLLGLSHGCRDPRCIRTKVDWKWSSWGLNQHPYGMQKLQVEAWHSMPQSQPRSNWILPNFEGRTDPHS